MSTQPFSRPISWCIEAHRLEPAAGDSSSPVIGMVLVNLWVGRSTGSIPSPVSPEPPVPQADKRVPDLTLLFNNASGVGQPSLSKR